MDKTTEIDDLKPRELGVVYEWRIWGEPGPLGPNSDKRYPPYNFTFRSDDVRWPHELAEARARELMETLARHAAEWEDGPHLSHRTVTYSGWTTVR